ncbi:MAG TPA: YciI family protein [Thermoplasmata archaeon]|nr:YciI family protein [Thermoplasmata archaeon]
MAHYAVGFLRRPVALSPLTEEEAGRLQEAHLAHLRHLVEQGELVAVGPFEEETELRGMLVFRTSSLEHARELMREDPAVRAGRLTLELRTWWATAALAGLRAPGTTAGPGALTFETD